MTISTSDQLRELYGFPQERPLKKVMPKLDKHSRLFLDKSPFAVLSTVSKDGLMDSSPRGGAPGFIKVLNDCEIAIPDSKGNNRLDSLVNIIETGRVGILLLVPGVDETLRINGSAHISTDLQLMELFDEEKRPPKTCLVVKVEEVFLHCAKALMRSKLWQPDSRIDRNELPGMGQMLKDQIGSSEEPESQEAMIKRYQADL